MFDAKMRGSSRRYQLQVLIFCVLCEYCALFIKPPKEFTNKVANNTVERRGIRTVSQQQLRRQEGEQSRTSSNDQQRPILLAANARIEETLFCAARNHCNSVVRKNKEFLDFADRNCFCDEVCSLYDDCCSDFVDGKLWSAIRRESRNRLKSQLKQTAICDRVPAINPDVEVYQVNSCPRVFQDEASAAREYCENYRSRDAFFSLPVSGTPSGVLYRNYFCAYCAGETNVSFWNVKLVCRESPWQGYSNQIRGDDVTSLIQEARRDVGDCRVEYQHSDFEARPCKYHISSCDPNWSDRKVRGDCQDGSTSYVYAGLKVFRNAQCAICNYVNVTYLSCADSRPSTLPDPLVKNLPPFSVHLDISTGGVNIYRIGENKAIDTSTTTVELRHCAENQVYDPFTKICRLVYCPRGERLVEGKCRLVDDELEKYIKPTLKTGGLVGYPAEPTDRLRIDENADKDDSERKKEVANINYDCSPFLLKEGEYWKLYNGSIRVKNVQQRVYNPEEFFYEGEQLYICYSVTNPKNYSNVEPNNHSTGSVIMFKFSSHQNTLSLVGVLISLLGLLVFLIVYLMLPSLHDVHGKCLINLALALFLTQLLFLIGAHLIGHYVVCVVVAVAMHYCVLTTFLWLSVLSFDLFRAFAFAISCTSDESHSKSLFAYSMCAWISPALIVAFSLAMDLLEIWDEANRPRYGDQVCWITGGKALVYLFAMPLAILIGLDLVFYAITQWFICATAKHTSNAVQETADNRLRICLCMKLCAVMTLTWLFALLAAMAELDFLWYVFVVLNTLQGVYICISFVCTRRVYRLLRAFFGREDNQQPCNRHVGQDRFHVKHVNHTDNVYLPNRSPRIMDKETSI